MLGKTSGVGVFCLEVQDFQNAFENDAEKNATTCAYSVCVSAFALFCLTKLKTKMMMMMMLTTMTGVTFPPFELPCLLNSSKVQDVVVNLR